jgi:hypothetical protein
MMNRDDNATLNRLEAIGSASLEILAEYSRRDLIDGYVSIGNNKRGGNWSRPVRADQFIDDVRRYRAAWRAMCSEIEEGILDIANTNAALYTTIQALACAYDLKSRGSRKTPGTFFEILIGSIMSQRLKSPRAKQVIVEVEGESVIVPTDIFFESRRLIVATKTSSRDRIIQPWGHQLLLDRISDSLTAPRYSSVLCLVGEVQLGRDEKKPCYPVCVPKQVTLYQKHVAQMKGLYYLDPPKAYLALSELGIIPVKTIGDLLSEIT